MRLFVQYFISKTSTDKLITILNLPITTSSSSSSSSTSDLPTNYSWSSLFSICIQFLSTEGISSPETYELHVQVTNLVIVLLSIQTTSSYTTTTRLSSCIVKPNTTSSTTSLLQQYEDSIAAGIDKEIHDPYLRLAMILGHEVYTPSDRVSPSKSKTTATVASSTTTNSETDNITRAQVLIRSLLRNVSLDGIRNEDSLTPGSMETYASTKSSLNILNQRNESARQYTKFSNSNGIVNTGSNTTNSSTTAAKAVNAIDTITNFTNNIVSVPVNLVGTFFFDIVEPVGKPLAERSALLLLLLCHNNRAAEKDKRLLSNPYREALQLLTDSRLPSMNYHPLPSLSDSKNITSSSTASTTNATTLSPANLLTTVSFKQLYTALVALCETPLGITIIYTLLQSCDLWNDYLLTRTDIDLLLIPLCQQLYYIYTLGSDHRYVLLITALLFTQDTTFCETAHQRIRLNNTSTLWFRERNQQLGNITLGSLLIICLMRAVSVTSSLSTTDASDSYLHTNAFAALANIAPHAENIHPYAAYKILSTLNSLHLKHKKLANYIDNLTTNNTNTSSTNNTGTTTSSSLSTNNNESLADSLHRLTGLLTHYESCIRVGSEALLAMCAPAALPKNLDLLYTLLHEHQVIDNLANNPDFEIETRSLLSIITHFSSVLRAEERVRLLAHAKTGSGGNAEVELLSQATTEENTTTTDSTVVSTSNNIITWQSTDVLTILSSAVHTWKGEDHDRAALIAEDLATQRFSYDEDDEPDVFFVPYIWSLTYAFTKSDLTWSTDAVKICSTDNNKFYVLINGSNTITNTSTAATNVTTHAALTHTGKGHGFESPK